jgi:hypothetical protein
MSDQRFYRKDTRLAWLKDHPQASFEEVYGELRRLDVIGRGYSQANLAVDRWFLTNQSQPTVLVDYDQLDIPDPYLRLQFAIIRQAAEDVMTGRPCDLHAWPGRKYGDTPPDRRQCHEEAHICAYDAAQYLLGLPPDIEELLNLPEGTLRKLMRGKPIPQPQRLQIVGVQHEGKRRLQVSV